MLNFVLTDSPALNWLQAMSAFSAHLPLASPFRKRMARDWRCQWNGKWLLNTLIGCSSLLPFTGTGSKQIRDTSGSFCAEVTMCTKRFLIFFCFSCSCRFSFFSNPHIYPDHRERPLYFMTRFSPYIKYSTTVYNQILVLISIWFILWTFDNLSVISLFYYFLNFQL